METARHAAVPLRGRARAARSRTRLRSSGSTSLRDSAGLEGRLDLAARGRKAAGNRRRQGGAPTVPLPPGFPGAAGAGEIRQARAASRSGCPSCGRRWTSTSTRSRSSFEWTAAVAVRLINDGWFRVGGERYAKTHRTFGITTLRKGHVKVRGSRIAFRFRAKHRVLVPHGARRRRARRRDEGAARAFRAGGRLFRYEHNGELVNLGARRLNDYIREYMGEEFTAKDFRTWGGTLVAAIELAERGRGRDGDRAEAHRRGGDALGRRAARKHARGCTGVVRQPGGRRAVSRRANDRRFSAAPFARRRRAGFRARSRGAGAAQPVAFLANSPGARSRLRFRYLSLG